MGFRLERRSVKYFVGYRAWREAFWAMMAIEQSEEIPMSVAEHCLPDNCYYVSKKEIDVATSGLGLDARTRFSSQGKSKKVKSQTVPIARGAEPAKN